VTAELHLEEVLQPAKPGGKPLTRRGHLEQLAKAKGAVRSPKLTLPPLDHDGEALRGLFAELSALRGSGGMGGVDPIRPQDVLAWGELAGRRLDPWEWAAIRQIDDAFRAEIARQADERSQKGPKT
jgi:hypothetical protein